MTDPREIMAEERAKTLSDLDALPLHSQGRADALAVCAAVQDAVNTLVAEMDRPVDPRVVPSALRALADEHERMMRRFDAEGLAKRLS